MKRLARLLFFLSLIGLLGFLVTINVRPEPEAVDFLPTETLALMQWEHLARSWGTWQGSAIGKKLNDRNVPKILKQLGFSESQVFGFKGLSDLLDRFSKSSIFSKIFSTKAVMALLPTLDNQPFNGASLGKHLVLLVPQGVGLPSTEQLEGFFGPVESNRTTSYQGVELVTLAFRSGQALTFCRNRGQLILALDASPVQRCIDQSLSMMVLARTGLQANQAFQSLKNRVGDQTSFFFYSDLAALLRQLPALPLEATPENGLVPHHLALFHQADAGYDRLSAIAQFPPGPLAAFIASHQLAPPAKDQVGQRLPPDTQFHLWTNWFKLKTLWDFGLQMKDQEAGALLYLLIQRVIEGSGLTSEEFFDVFGSQFGVFITEQQTAQLPNRTMSCLYFEVRDQQEVAAMLKRVLRGLQVITVLTGGLEIGSVNMAGGLLQPAFALKERHLILADSVALIEQIQNQGEGDPAADPNHLGAAKDRAGNLFLFARSKHLADRLMAMLPPLLKENTDQEKILSPRARLLIEHALFPVLKTLQTVPTVTLRGTVAGEEMILEMDVANNREGAPIFPSNFQ
jgi:hypothetical protein